MTPRALLSVALLATAAGCGAGAEPRARTHTVAIRGFAFEPATLQAAPGDTVVWRNEDVVPHTATAAGRWDSGAIPAGGSWTLVVREDGAVEYLCAYHPTMKGTLRSP